MANINLFASKRQRATVTNEAGGRAYLLSEEQKLAQYAATGCMNDLYYNEGGEQLDLVLDLCTGLSADFIAQTAIYARRKGYMKDMPALLCAVLSTRDEQRFAEVFDAVIDSGRMLRSFVQIMRSGAVGRRSLGSLPRRKVREWIQARGAGALVANTVGQSPSLRDVLRMVRPKPDGKERSALYAWIVGKEYAAEDLPQPALGLERFKQGDRASVPDVPFQILSSLQLTQKHWRMIAKQVPWQTLRMNLNTFLRHGVFEDGATVRHCAARLRDAEAISRARVFPYQLLAAYMNSAHDMPNLIVDALQEAMEIAVQNVPKIDGKVVICVDVSGSMHGPVTGSRKGASTKVRCVDAAALFAAALLRKNRGARVIPFSDRLYKTKINPRDSIMTNAEKLSSLPSGGTDCAAPLRHMNKTREKADLVVLVSDNESWVHPGDGRSTVTMSAWRDFRKRCKGARLACIDMQPYATVQAPVGENVLHVGGFSDQVFAVLRDFAESGSSKDHWVRKIHAVPLRRRG